MAAIISLDRERSTRNLFQEHENEAADQGAEFLNHGWFSERNRIFSKTTNGILESRVNPKTMRVVHFWSHKSFGPISLDDNLA